MIGRVGRVEVLGIQDWTSCRWVLAALGKSEFGLIGVVGGMTVIVLLAYTMRSVRGRIAAVGTKATVAIYCGNHV